MPSPLSWISSQNPDGLTLTALSVNLVAMSSFDVIDAYAFIRQEITFARAKELKAVNLSVKQIGILFRLSLSPATMGELAEYTMADKASTSRTVASLESGGYVKRSSAAGDRRVSRMELTPKGALKVTKIQWVRKMLGAKINDVLNASEQKQLARLMNKLAQNLKDKRKKPKK